MRDLARLGVIATMLAAASAACAVPPAGLAGDAGSRAVDAEAGEPASDARSSDPADTAPAEADATPPDGAAGGGPDACAAVDGGIPACGGAVVGAPCAGCGVIACADGKPFCDTGGAPCQMFAQVFTSPVAAGDQVTVHGGGIAFGDASGDGHVDVAVAAPDRLRVFFGDGAGGFVPIQEPFSGVAKISSVTWADHDGDGDLDLFLTANAPAPSLHLYRNDGGGLFTDLSAAMAFPTTGAPRGVAWADYDGDGWLDVFVAGYQTPSLLLRNLSGAGFASVAADVGLAFSYLALQPLWLDFDVDGDPDLFLTIDRGPSFHVSQRLFRNDGAAGFTDVSLAAGITHLFDGMGVAAGDVDGDLDVDLYVSNIGWLAPGQVLYLNQGDGTFQLGSAAWNVVADDRWGWGADFFDYDNDGDVDLALATSYPRPWMGESLGARFLDVTDITASWPVEDTYGFAVADFDRDGRQDVGWLLWNVGDATVGARLYRNVIPAPGHWLSIRLLGPAPNTWGIGARVYVDTCGRRQMRLVTAGNSYLSASEPIAHFGLGDAAVVDSIEIHWPGGAVTTVPGPIAADQHLQLAP